MLPKDSDRNHQKHVLLEREREKLETSLEQLVHDKESLEMREREARLELERMAQEKVCYECVGFMNISHTLKEENN
jgi:hypothetical protein